MSLQSSCYLQVLKNKFTSIVHCSTQITNYRAIPSSTPKSACAHCCIRIFQNAKTSFNHGPVWSESPRMSAMQINVNVKDGRLLFMRTLNICYLLTLAATAAWLNLGNTITGCLFLNPWSAIICKPAGNTGIFICLHKKLSRDKKNYGTWIICI